LRRLADELQAISGRSPAAHELLACVTAEEGADGLLAQLHALRRNLPMGNMEFFRLVRSREYLPLEAFVQIARGRSRCAKSRTWRKPLLISGSFPSRCSSCTRSTNAARG
jgi:hypothetical protein